MSQAEDQGVAGHGRPDVPVGLDEAVGERRHGEILVSATEDHLAQVDLVGTIGYNRDHPATITLMHDGRIDARSPLAFDACRRAIPPRGTGR
jgi:hypothetical protein